MARKSKIKEIKKAMQDAINRGDLPVGSKLKIAKDGTLIITRP